MAAVNFLPPVKSKRKLHNLRIDMTPMVDLGFLLITFFIFTTSMMEPTVTRLVMPADGAGMPVPSSKALTILVDNNKAFVYDGIFDEAKAAERFIETDFNVRTGIGELIRQKQKQLGPKNADDLVVSIKALPTSRYGDVMNALDEMKINDVKIYALVDVTKEEKEYASQLIN